MDSKTNKEKAAFSLPSAYELAMLAVAMKKSPEEALRIWSEAQYIRRRFEKLSEERKSQSILLMAMVPGWTFEDCFELTDDFVPLEKGMNMLGIRSIKTFEKLLHRHWRDLEDPAAVENMLNDIRARNEISLTEIQSLLVTKKALNAERGRVNRLSAMKKRKPVK